MNQTTTIKMKRSVELTSEELAYLIGFLDTKESKTQAAIALGISKDVFDRTINYGSCSEKTYNILFPRKGNRRKAA